MRMGSDQWELEGMGTVIVFPHTSSLRYGEEKSQIPLPVAHCRVATAS